MARDQIKKIVKLTESIVNKKLNEATDHIADLKAYRMKNKNNVSTSHTFSFNDFMNIAKDLRLTFKKFSVDVDGNNVKVTIPTKPF